MKTKIKICGITNIEDALKAEALGADFIGLIFTQHSKRCIASDQAKTIASRLTSAKPVGVFIEQNREETLSMASHVGLYGIQHHKIFEQKFEDYFYIQAQSVDKKFDFVQAMKNSIPDVFLFDTKMPGQYGGTGKSFDWSFLPQDKMNKIIIAGGIGLHNIQKALSLKPYGIDLSSSVESAPGIKDHHLLQNLFQEINNAKHI